MTAAPGRRIVVYGPSGSGKTTFSRELARGLGLPAIELDAIYHSRPNWHDLSTEEFRDAVECLLAVHPDGWVIDGNYSAVRDLILPHAETAIWLRLPFRVVYSRLARRTLRRMWTREPLWDVNYESFRLGFFSRDSILLWGITNWRPHHHKTRAALRHAKALGVRVIVLRTPAEVARYLAALPAIPEMHP
jgi:hypothetical protein